MRSSLLLLALLAACGTGVSDLSRPVQPLGVVKGRIDRAALGAKLTGAPLRAAIVWAGVSQYDPLCGQWASENAELGAVCPDPLRMAVGEIEASVAITPDADGVFELPVMKLPSAQVAVGGRAGRISYASVFVGEDVDGDGILNIHGMEFENAPKERPLAASFITLGSAQQRLVFREGAFDKESYFYPAQNCAEPPVGFSVMKAPTYSEQPTNEVCEVASLATPLDLTPLADEQARFLECRLNVLSYVLNPSDEFVGSENPVQCADPENAFVIIEGYCPTLLHLPLKGCYDDALCEEPHWDLRAKPPSWWPC